MCRISYRKAVDLYIGRTLRIIDDEPYRLVSQVTYEDRVELGWEHVIIKFTDTTMVKFPGRLNCFTLTRILNIDQLPKNPRIKEVVRKGCLWG